MWPLRADYLFLPAFQVFKARCSKDSSFWCRTHRLGKPVRGSDPVFLVEDLYNRDYLLVCGCAYPGVWVLTIPCLCPSYPTCCGSFFVSLVVEKSFLLVLRLFSSTVVKFVILMCPWEVVSSRSSYSNILATTP